MLNWVQFSFAAGILKGIIMYPKAAWGSHVLTWEQYPFSPNCIVRNAMELLGEREYNLFNRNCQSFAIHCYYDKAISNAILTGGYIIGAALLVAAGAVVYVANQVAHTPWAM